MSQVQRAADGVRVDFLVAFEIVNEGRIAAYKWRFVFEGVGHCSEAGVGSATYMVPLKPMSRYGSIPLDDTLLPEDRRSEQDYFAVRFPSHAIQSADDVRGAVEALGKLCTSRPTW